MPPCQTPGHADGLWLDGLLGKGMLYVCGKNVIGYVTLGVIQYKDAILPV